MLFYKSEENVPAVTDITAMKEVEHVPLMKLRSVKQVSLRQVELGGEQGNCETGGNVVKEIKRMAEVYRWYEDNCLS